MVLSPVYSVFLNATKVLHRVEYCKLFDTLLARNLPPVFVRLLLNMYTSHVTRIMWNGFFSDRFSDCNGVKQVGILSPVLFCVYIDGLLQHLARSKIGYNFGMTYVGVLAYADDIVLLAPTASAMRMLLSICDDCANEHHVVFNAKKLKCMQSSTQL